MKIIIRKLNNNIATVRDYQVAWCLQKKEDLVLEYEKSQILIPYRFIEKAGTKRKNVEYSSKFSDQKYGLIDFYWTESYKDPEEEIIKVKQERLF